MGKNKKSVKLKPKTSVKPKLSDGNNGGIFTLKVALSSQKVFGKNGK